MPTNSVKREFKGKSANRHLDDYCIVDLETTSNYVSSAKIIEISALKIRNNQVVTEYTTLVNPHCHIPDDATAVNHITDDMVCDAPSLENVISAFLDFVGDDVVLGYNNAYFDMNILYDWVAKLRKTPFRNDYIDLYHVAKRSINDIANYRLVTVGQYFGIDASGAHRALNDCYLTKHCYDRLYESFGDSAFARRDSFSTGKGVRYSSNTYVLRELQCYLRTVIEMGTIAYEAVSALAYCFEDNMDLAKEYPFNVLFQALKNVIEDGVITAEEQESLKTVFAEIVDPVSCNGSCEEISTLCGKHVCLTGDFDYGTKEQVEKLIVAAGGLVDKNVKRATNYLVVGAQGSDAWKTNSYGGKIQKAMEYQSKGIDVKIMEETVFIPKIVSLIESL